MTDSSGQINVLCDHCGQKVIDLTALAKLLFVVRQAHHPEEGRGAVKPDPEPEDIPIGGTDPD